ncbi:PadR family transcriptional regulator [Streptomyces sp. NPDC015414]|uniref:PadR family transcriptional regulator n=1 Tax=Streptomyces sp. NPDC015414 TaxID=3364957 RepID=UPI0036F86A6A
MEPFNRWTRVAIDVTRYVCERHMTEPDFEFYGFQAADELGYGPGSIYPVVRRLERAGWLISREERDNEPRETGRPPRTYYRVNPEHLQAIRQRVAELDARARKSASITRPVCNLNPVTEVGHVGGGER